MNMTTSVQNIPMKTSKINNDNDDSEDPIVKDILQEFQEELKENQKSLLPNPPSQPDAYQINYNPPPQQLPQPVQTPQQQKPPKNNFYMKYYNQEILIKTAIIITIIAFVFSPTIFNTFMDKIPYTLAQILNQYDFYIKLILAFIFVYIYNLF